MKLDKPSKAWALSSLWPSEDQWRRWSLVSKLTAIGTLVGVTALTLGALALVITVIGLGVSLLSLKESDADSTGRRPTLGQSYQFGYDLILTSALHGQAKDMSRDTSGSRFATQLALTQALADQLELKLDLGSLDLSRPADQSPIYSESVTLIEEQVALLHGERAKKAFRVGLLNRLLLAIADPEAYASDYDRYHWKETWVPEFNRLLKELGVRARLASSLNHSEDSYQEVLRLRALLLDHFAQV